MCLNHLRAREVSHSRAPLVLCRYLASFSFLALAAFATQAHAASRCIISEDKGRGAMVTINLSSRRRSRRVPLANSAEIDKKLWYTVIDADVKNVEKGAILSNVKRAANPPLSEWFMAIQAAHFSEANEVVRTQAQALIARHPGSITASRVAKYWAKTYEREQAWSKALEVYERYLKKYPKGERLSILRKHANRIKVHCIGKPNWAQFYSRSSEIEREVKALGRKDLLGAKAEKLRRLLRGALNESKEIPGVMPERSKAADLLLRCAGKKHLPVVKELLSSESDDKVRGSRLARVLRSPLLAIRANKSQDSGLGFRARGSGGPPEAVKPTPCPRRGLGGSIQVERGMEREAGRC